MNFFNKKKQQEEGMGFKVFVDENNKVEIEVSFPEVESREEAEKIAKEFALMVVSVVKPPVLPYLQTTIANHGVKTNNEKLSNLILIWINNIINPTVVDNNSPVVQPDQAFSVRGNSQE